MRGDIPPGFEMRDFRERSLRRIFGQRFEIFNPVLVAGSWPLYALFIQADFLLLLC